MIGPLKGVPDAAVEPVMAEDAVRLLYEAERGRLFRALLAWTGSFDVADEAVAEAFAQLLRRGDEVRDQRAWTWTAAFRIAAGDLQRRGRTGSTSQDGVEPVARIDRLPDEAVDLLRALAHLTDQQRQCVALVDVAGHTAVEAAGVLGTSPATVRQQLMRARRRLRILLTDPEEIP
ncbi:MAG: putative polymerase subfamily sigma factor [Acidimicrobiales bacterium]|nr:putative polymerase subfamily sigma factor [Acidimicrobiales bacterium]